MILSPSTKPPTPTSSSPKATITAPRRPNNGGPTGSAAAFREGYDKVYERLGIEPVIITNNADFDSAYTEFSALIDSWRL